MSKDVKINANIDGLNTLMRCLKEDWAVRIGILGGNATAQHDSESGLTNAKLGAVHEFGAEINMPARDVSVYRSIGKNGEFKFDGKFRKKKLKSTNWEETYHIEAHTINIPQRSFLRMPLEKELFNEMKSMKKVIFKQFFVKKAPEEFYKALASKALVIVRTAFGEGRTEWQPLTAATKRRKAAQHLSPNTLVGRGTLGSSITTKVFKK